VTTRGIGIVERHLGRFAPHGLEGPERAMVERLRAIATGSLEPTEWDLRFYSHELREFVRYRNLGYSTGQPSDADMAYEMWNNAHTAALEDYGVNELEAPLYHTDARP
jgi:hypothetical protein